MARAPCSDEGEAERNEAADDKAGTNAAIKKLIADTKLTKYVSDGIVSGSKFVDAVGLPSGVDEVGPNMK